MSVLVHHLFRVFSTENWGWKERPLQPLLFLPFRRYSLVLSQLLKLFQIIIVHDCWAVGRKTAFVPL
jgi:hypothetical protein